MPGPLSVLALKYLLRSWKVSKNKENDGERKKNLQVPNFDFFYFLLGDAFWHLDSPMSRVTGADVPTPYAANLEAFAFPDEKVIVKAVRDNLDKKIGF
jgi:hypothetical protein